MLLHLIHESKYYYPLDFAIKTMHIKMQIIRDSSIQETLARKLLSKFIKWYVALHRMNMFILKYHKLVQIYNV